MDFRQLQYFLAVAEELHFGRAALKMHIAEQPMGYQIRKLENELGLKLFDRTTRSVRLTPAGESFRVDAQRAVAQMEHAADVARQISQGGAGIVRLGYESATVVSVLPDFVKLFRAEYPEIGIELVEHSKEGLSPLTEGDTDACLITRFARIPKGFDYLPITHDRAVIALSTEHPLSDREELSLADMADTPFLGYADAKGESANRFMAELVEYAGSGPTIRHEADTYTALLGLVSAKLGFTIVTSAMAKLFPDKVSYIPLVNPEVGVDYGLAMRENDWPPVVESLRVVAGHLSQIYE